jgi:hypothetical protein
MSVTKFTIMIDGPNILAPKFIEAIQAFYATINDVAEQVIQDKNVIQWVVSVEEGSDLVHFKPFSSEQRPLPYDEISRAISGGIEMLEGGTDHRPEFFTDIALEGIKRLGRIVDPKHETIDKVEVRLNGTIGILSSQSVASVEKILGAKYEAIGSIEGNLEMISQRNEFHCNVWEALTDRKVRCVFDNTKQEVIKKVIGAFGRRVAIYGKIKYRKDGTPESIIVDDIRVFREPHELPTLDVLEGLLENK